MPRPWRIRFAGAKYHVTSRGNARQEIFLGPKDYARFVEQLGSALELDGVVLYAYALLGNHTHLLVETPLGNIQKFMQRLNTAYSMYFRYKHSRPGHCLQGRYSAKLVSGDDYLVRLTRYIHLNPVKTVRMKGRPLEERIGYLNRYRWSSYKGYVDREAEEEMVDYRWLRLMGRKTMRGNRAAYRKYAEGMIAGKDEELAEVMGASRYAIGDEEFREEVEADLKEVRLEKGVYGGDIVWPVGEEKSLEEVEELVLKEYRLESGELRGRVRRGEEAKKVVLELCCELTRKSQREIGRYFGYTSDSAVGKQRQKLKELLAKNKALQRRLTRLKKKLTSA